MPIARALKGDRGCPRRASKPEKRVDCRVLHGSAGLHLCGGNNETILSRHRRRRRLDAAGIRQEWEPVKLPDGIYVLNMAKSVVR